MRRRPLLSLPALMCLAGIRSIQLPRLGSAPSSVHLTPGAPAKGELVVWMPVSVVLPSVRRRPHYSSPATAKSQRHLDGDSPTRADQVEFERAGYDWSAPEYRACSPEGPLLARIDAYFHQLEVAADPCRRRILCQLARRPAAFQPVSSLLLRALRKSDSFGRRGQHFASPSGRRLASYVRAAQLGAAGESCRRVFSCAHDLEDVVSVPAVRLWQLLAALLQLRITDD